jgi:GNAT superfamily N-acetyltransferase
MSTQLNHTTSELAEPTPADLAALGGILQACVDAGASVGFMWPFGAQQAEAFWAKVARGVRAGERHLLVARDPSGQIVGTAQLVVDLPPNQAHRADVCKVLVHPNAQRQGVAQALMEATEALAKRLGKTCLVLDTVTHSTAYRLYQRCGWQIAGDIPHYAHMPGGEPCSTTYFFKLLQPA